MKILLIDDHALFRDGILLMLDGLNVPITAFEAESFESAKKIIGEQKSLDLVLLDLGLPGINGIDALTGIRRQLPDTLLVVLSGTDDHKTVEEVLLYGAQGYITKSSSAKIMLNALQLVIDGGIYVPPEILYKTANTTLSDSAEKRNKKSNNKITPRQFEVLQQLVKGKSNKEIGAVLNLTESTVRVHVAAILKSFDVKNRTQATQFAIKNDLIIEGVI